METIIRATNIEADERRWDEFRLHFEENLENLQPRHILRFINSVGSRHYDICIIKAWIESSDTPTMINIKVLFTSYKNGKNTKYLYTDFTTYDRGCSNATITEVKEV